MNPNLIKSLWAVALAIGLSLGCTALIKANKVTTTSVERTPMPVAATVYSQQPTFTRNANYLGVIKAGSDSVLGFEVAGVLTDLPATEGIRVSPGDVLAQLGTDRIVLFEGENKEGYIHGFTENYVKVKTPWNPELVNTLELFL